MRLGLQQSMWYVPPPMQLEADAPVPGGAQSITFTTTTNVDGIGFMISPEQGIYCCTESLVSIYRDASGTLGSFVTSTNSLEMHASEPSGERDYRFSAPIVFSPGIYWFEIEIPPKFSNGMYIAGSKNDAYSGGFWSTAPTQDAYFRILEDANPP